MFVAKISCVSFLVLLNALCALSSDFALVVDDSFSIMRKLNDIKEITKDLIYVFKNEGKEDLILVTFNDPDVNLIAKTSNTTVFAQAVNNIKPHNIFNPDCPEYSLSGIELALKVSRPGSTIFVATDASAKDYRKFADIKLLCQQKKTEVKFLIVGDCFDRTSPQFTVYKDIEQACVKDLEAVKVVQKRDLKNVMQKLKLVNTENKARNH